MNEELALRAVLALESMAAPNWVDIGGLAIGLAQCVLIYYGLRLMNKGSTERTTQLKTQHEESMAAHKETMAVMQAQHAENMATHKENMAAHEAGMAALKELIRRTAPRS